jgi:hypothetical protein
MAGLSAAPPNSPTVPARANPPIGKVQPPRPPLTALLAAPCYRSDAARRRACAKAGKAATHGVSRPAQHQRVHASTASQIRPSASAQRQTGGPGTSRAPCGAGFAKVWFARTWLAGVTLRGRHRQCGRRAGSSPRPPLRPRPKLRLRWRDRGQSAGRIPGQDPLSRVSPMSCTASEGLLSDDERTPRNVREVEA